MFIGIDQWILRTDQPPLPVGDAPEYDKVNTRIELRNLEGKRKTGGYGIFVYDDFVDLEFPLGDIHDYISSNKRKDLAKKFKTDSIPDMEVRDIIWWMCTTQGDPTGVEKWRGFLPNKKRKLRLKLGDDIRYETFNPSVHTKVIPLLQENYRALRSFCLENNSDTYRRRLSVWAEKYKLPSNVFIPADLPVELPLPHATTIYDDFNRANANPPGEATVATVGQGWSWADVEGDVSLVSNVLTLTASTRGTLRAASNLDSDDHYSQAVIASNAGDTAIGGTVIRQPASATMTNYVGFAGFNDSPNQWRIVEYLTGAGTNRDATEGNPTSGATFLLTIEGTQIYFYQNAVQECDYDDNASETGAGTLQTGVCGYRGSSATLTWDNFEAGDMGAAEGWTNIASFMGVDEANISTIGGVAKANIAKLKGVAV